MGINDIFSKRQRRQRGDAPDVYTYDEIPTPLKVQIVQIWQDTLGDSRAYDVGHYGTRQAYQSIVKALRREYGVFVLPGCQTPYNNSAILELSQFLMQELDPEKALDAIELSFKVIDRATRRVAYLSRTNATILADAAINELNARFREHSIGYEFDGEIIRVDSQLLHAETVKPALALLAAPGYAGAQEEFLAAHDHYRHGRAKETLIECLKALESAMKAICAKRGWTHDPNATAKVLIGVLFEKGLVPAFWEQHFSALRSTLEAGVPTARNRLGGHGQGTEVVSVPLHIVAYVLHLSASAIVFLAEAEKAQP